MVCGLFEPLDSQQLLIVDCSGEPESPGVLLPDDAAPFFAAFWGLFRTPSRTQTQLSRPMTSGHRNLSQGRLAKLGVSQGSAGAACQVRRWVTFGLP